MGAHASALSAPERRFWLLLAVGLGLALPVHVLGLLNMDSKDTRVDLIQDVCLISYYVAISLKISAELRRRRR